MQTDHSLLPTTLYSLPTPYKSLSLRLSVHLFCGLLRLVRAVKPWIWSATGLAMGLQLKDSGSLLAQNLSIAHNSGVEGMAPGPLPLP